MMMNVHVATGCGGSVTRGMPETQARESGNDSVDQPAFQLETSFLDKPRAKHMSTCDHTTHELNTHNEHPLWNDQQHKTMMMQ